MEIEILLLLNRHQSLFVGLKELHGYFNFRSLDSICDAVSHLIGQKYIEEHQKPAYGYYITDSGKHRLLELEKDRKSRFWKVILSVVTVLIAAAASIAAWVH